jgi:MFS family permease
MSTKLQDFDSSFNNTSLVSSEGEANQISVAYKQIQQTRILYLVYFLSTLSYHFSLSLSNCVIMQYLSKDSDEKGYDIKILFSYTVFTGTCANFVWGFISDRVGRKVALNISLIGSALTIPLYGFSKSFNSLAFANALLGIFSCNGIFIKTMVGEANEKISRPNAFRYFPIIGMVAQALAPMFTVPFFVSHLHDVKLNRDMSFVSRLLYIIPSLIGSGISVAAYITSDRFLDETLAVKGSKNDRSAITDTPSSQKITLKESNQIGLFGLNFSKDSLLVLIGSSLLTLVIKVYSKMSKEWPKMEISKGGLNLNTLHLMSVSPLLSIMVVSIFFKHHYIYKKIGALKQFKVGFIATGVLFVLSLVLTLIAKTGSTFIVLSLFAILCSIKSGITILKGISFDILLTESAEFYGNLGTLYGISNTLSGATYLIINYASKSISSFSTENTLPFPLNFKLTWILVVFSLIGYWLSSKINNTTQNQEIVREHEY